MRILKFEKKGSLFFCRVGVWSFFGKVFGVLGKMSIGIFCFIFIFLKVDGCFFGKFGSGRGRGWWFLRRDVISL